jgi:hypothetical protein
MTGHSLGCLVDRQGAQDMARCWPYLFCFGLFPCIIRKFGKQVEKGNLEQAARIKRASKNPTLKSGFW